MYIEDNYVRTRYYKPCLICEGKGETFGQVSYYDSGWEKCESCLGTGYKFVKEMIQCRVDQPFTLAKD